MRRRSLLAAAAAALLTLLLVVLPDRAESATKPGPPEPTWVPLFNGHDLATWRKIGVGEWTVEDGVIVGRHRKADKEYGHLVSEREFSDFAVRLKFKSVQGNSGLYFRIAVDEKKFSGVAGFQAEIDPKADVGGLYETNGRAWVVKPTKEQVAKYFKPGEWNDMTVTARGGDITVTINGTVSAELKNDPGKFRKGPLALQVHGGQDGLVYFKDIEVMQLPPD
jgi:hypothetical protein